jgi:pilus assembly protein Flp/PilA
MRIALLLDFCGDDSGVTAIEYGLIGSLIAVGLIVLYQGAGGSISALYERIAACLTIPTTAAC